MLLPVSNSGLLEMTCKNIWLGQPNWVFDLLKNLEKTPAILEVQKLKMMTFSKP